MSFFFIYKCKVSKGVLFICSLCGLFYLRGQKTYLYIVWFLFWFVLDIVCVLICVFIFNLCQEGKGVILFVQF